MPILPVPQVTQWGIQANWRRTDCGVACALMCLEFYGRRGDLTVDALAHETSLKYGDDGLAPAEVAKILTDHGLPARSVKIANTAVIKAEIDAGRPVIALIAYRYITNRLDIGDNVPGRDAHFLTIVGYDDTHWIADDPDYWVPYVERGHDTRIAFTDLEKALSPYGDWCVFVETTEQMPTITDAGVAKLVALKGEIDAILGQVTTDKPDPTPAPKPTSRTMYSRFDNVNVRADHDVRAQDLGDLSRGEMLIVTMAATRDAENEHDWVQILAGPHIGNWVALELLSDRPL